MRVLVLGATGMLGSAVFRYFSSAKTHETWGTLRDAGALRFFSEDTHPHLISGVDVLDQDGLISVMQHIRPNVVVNCIGLIKQLADASDPLQALPINSLLPHRLARLCALSGARLIHVSTDCVFSGKKGDYKEFDTSDAEDLYGKSKFIGELHEVKNAITLRTSIIGHELNSARALVDWFLNREGSVQGYRKAVFSGLPTVELARVIHDYVLSNPELYGLYHVSSKPITKFDLLSLVAKVYEKDIKIIPYDSVVIDRSLNSARFTQSTGYFAPEWIELVGLMHKQH